MESSGSSAKNHTEVPHGPETRHRWSFMIGENLVKGITAALSTSSVSLFIWWIQSR